MRCIRDKGRFAKHNFMRNPSRDNCRPKSKLNLFEYYMSQEPQAHLCIRCGAEYWTSRQSRKRIDVMPALPEENELLGDLPFVKAAG